jgi:methionine-gamma-lyase
MHADTLPQIFAGEIGPSGGCYLCAAQAACACLPWSPAGEFVAAARSLGTQHRLLYLSSQAPPHPSVCSYGRSFNPTVRYLGRQLAALEGGEAAYCCASGMAAISATLLALCNSGDHIVCSNAVYGGTFALMKVSEEQR